MRVTNFSTKQQLTFSKQELDILGLKNRGQVIIQREKGMLLIKPVKNSIVDQTAGSLTKYVSGSLRGIPFQKILMETKKKTARKLATHI